MKNVYVIVRHDNDGCYPVSCASNYKTAQRLLKVYRLRFLEQQFSIVVLPNLWKKSDDVVLDESIERLNKYEK